jgi:hypothetical protein
MKRTKLLQDLSHHEYETLKRMGFLWEFYPQATGDWMRDCADPALAQACSGKVPEHPFLTPHAFPAGTAMVAH